MVDILLTGVALCIFALFHHVLPREQESVGIVIPNPYGYIDTYIDTTDEEGPVTETAVASLRNAELIAAGSRDVISDTGANLLARGRQSQKVPSSKGGSALTQEDVTEDDDGEAAETVPMSEKFAEKYTDTVVETENSYTSSGVAVTVSEETLDGGRITYYVADIYLKNVTSFQTALARNRYGSGFRAEISDMASMMNALVAVNGDYYGNTNEGVVIRNGVIYRANPTNCDVCVLYYDGTMKVMPGSSFTVEDAIADGAWQAWTFGPALLDGEGHAISSFSSTNRIISANPRTAIGYYEPGHYCLVVVDGRGA
mgnify:FL=1